MDFIARGDGHEKCLLFSGRFTFNDSLKFKEALAYLQHPGLKCIILDFANVDFIDSAALGMLLLLRDQCMDKHIAVTLQSAHGQVATLLTLSKFDELFSMPSSKAS